MTELLDIFLHKMIAVLSLSMDLAEGNKKRYVFPLKSRC